MAAQSSVSLRRRRPTAVLAAVVLAAVLAVPACEGIPLVAPAGTGITLVASPANLWSDGSAEITAVLTEGAQGAPSTSGQFDVLNGVGTYVHDGTVVTFLTSLGRLQPSETTTKNGRASVRFYPDGATGTATITAYSGGSRQTVQLTVVAPG